MKQHYVKQLLLALVMISVAVLANYTRPTQYLSELSPRNLLSKDVPKVIKNWEVEPSDDLMVVDPTQLDVLKYLYADLYSATYINSDNQRAMLSIAYGKDQSDGHEVHRPELCYPAQGFTLLEKHDFPIQLDATHTIIAHYMEMQRGQRVEPLIYWTLAGDHVYASKMQRREITFDYSMKNLIPDGMIVRVSTLEKDPEIANQILRNFVLDWYASLSPSVRTRFFGQASS